MLVLTEILEQRRREREELRKQARLGLTLGIFLRYAWITTKVLLLLTAAGVFAVLYVFFKIVFSGNTGR
ncbi:MAG: hypothetical protein EBS38_02545 [Actinobacteria bacterium]|nr:hypothetical protein [Actinomycetota bacterium]